VSAVTVAVALGVTALVFAPANPDDAVSAGPTCRAAIKRTGQTGTWTRVGAPDFSKLAAGTPQGISAHAVDVTDPEAGWYITNGVFILSSRDLGCTWEQAFSLDDVRATVEGIPVGARVDALSAAAGVVVATIAPAAADSQTAVVAATLVTSSGDAGKTWTEPLPLAGAGTPGPVAVSRANPTVVYAAAGKIAHRSSDGGKTFAPTAPTNAPRGLGIDDIAVDPLDPDNVWLKSSAGISFSDNGGTTWTEQREQGPLGGLAVGRDTGGGGTRVVSTVLDGQGLVGGVLDSQNGGGDYTQRGSDSITGLTRSMTAGGDRDDITITTGGQQDGADPGVFRWFPQRATFENFDQFNLSRGGALQGATAEAEDDARVFFFRDDRVVVWELPAGGVNAAVPVPPGLRTADASAFDFFTPPQAPVAPPAKLKPGEGDVTIPVGGSTTVKYSLSLPAQPTKLDSFFLMDTSGSTDPYIDGLKAGLGRLIRELLKGYTDSNFGLGEYQTIDGSVDEDDDSSGSTSGVSCTRYRRISDITAPDKSFQELIAGINTCGGSEAGYMAAHQVATGSGILEPRTGRKVRPGRNANWRDESLRLLVHIADEPFSFDPDGADAKATIAALKERRMKFIGFDMSGATTGASVTIGGSGTGGPALPASKPDCTQAPLPSEEEQNRSTFGVYCQLWEIAKETGTFAPRGGVDCNADGKADVREGEPLVCQINTDTTTTGFVEMAEPIRELLLAIPDERRVTLQQEGEAEIGVGIKALGETLVDVHGDHDLEFEVTLSCTAAQAQKAFPVRFAARLNGKLQARAKARAICGTLPVPPPLPAASAPIDPPKKAKKPAEAPVQNQPVPPFVAPILPPPAFAVALTPPPPPAPVNSLQPANAPAQAQAPASAPGTAAAPASAVVPAAVAAKAPEVQTEMNVLRTDPSKEKGVEELKFSRVDDDEAEAQATALLESGGSGEELWVVRLLGAGAVMAGAFALEPRRRRQIAARKARIR